MKAAPEGRWIVLTTDGRHVTLGTPPTHMEIADAIAAMRTAEQSGWLVHQKGIGDLVPVQRIGTPPKGSWPKAAAAFHAARPTERD